MKKISWYFFAMLGSWCFSFPSIQAQEQFGEDTEKPVINNVIIIFNYNGSEVIQTINHPTSNSTESHNYGEGGVNSSTAEKQTRILVGEQLPINELANNEETPSPTATPVKTEEVFSDYTNQPSYQPPSAMQSFGGSTFRQVTAYPNPTTDVLYIEGSVSEQTTMNLYNLVGQKVRHQSFDNLTKQKIAVGDLPSGIYILETLGKGWKAVQKIKINDN